MTFMKWPNVLQSKEGRERQRKIKWSNHGVCAKKTDEDPVIPGNIEGKIVPGGGKGKSL